MTGPDLPAGRANLIATRYKTIWSEHLNVLVVSRCAFTVPDEPMRASTPWRNAHMSIFQTIGYRLRVGQLRSMHCYHRPSAYFAANTFRRIFTPAIPLKAKSIATESGLLPCYRHSNMAAPGMCHSHSISRF